jgi:outer membrane immunogenic protein
MKRVALALIAVAASALPSLAADMPVRRMERMEMMPVKGPAVLPFNWGGWYGGVNLGGGWADDNVDGILGGVQMGYNWQMGQIVFGVETDLQGTGMSGNRRRGVGGGVVLRENQDLDWFGTTRARVGYAVWDRWLPYFTVGLAYGTRHVSGNATGAAAGRYNSDDTGIGFAIGAGVDYAINQWWSARLEYLHLTLDGFDRRYRFGAARRTARYGDLDADIFRGAINYRFLPW